MGLCVIESSGFQAGADKRQADMLAHPDQFGGYMGSNIKMSVACPNPRFGSGYYSDTDRGPSGWWYHATCATCGSAFHAQGSNAEESAKRQANSPHNYDQAIPGTCAIFPVS